MEGDPPAPTVEPKKESTLEIGPAYRPADASISGRYFDLQHPDGFRSIDLTSPNEARISGQDSSSGALWEGSAFVEGRLVRAKLPPTQEGGPLQVLDAVYDGTSLHFLDDGNRWIKHTSDSSPRPRVGVDGDENDTALDKSRLNQELAELRLQYAWALHGVENATSHHWRFKQLFDSVQARAGEFEAKAASLSTQVHELDEKRSALVNELASKSELFEKANTAQTQAAEHAQLLQAELEETKEKLTQVQTAVQQTATLLEQSRSKEHELEQELGRLQQDASTSQAELSALQERYHALQVEFEFVQEEAENPDLVLALTRTGEQGVTRLYRTNPAIAAAINKTVDILYPTLREKQFAGAMLLNQTQQAITENMKPYVAREYLPLVSGLLVYGIVFIPLFVSFWCLASVKAVLRLRPMLLFCHFYFSVASVVAAVATVVISADPLIVFQNQDAGTYLFFQGIMFLLFVVYIGMLITAFLCSRNRAEYMFRSIQLGLVLTAALSYYSRVWEPAMLERPPEVMFPDTPAVSYVAASLIFIVVLGLEQAQRRQVASDPTVRVAPDEDTIMITVESAVDPTPAASTGGASKRE